MSISALGMSKNDKNMCKKDSFFCKNAPFSQEVVVDGQEVVVDGGVKDEILELHVATVEWIPRG